MRKLGHLFPWQVSAAAEQLREFRSLVVGYFNSCTYDRAFGERAEKPESADIRRDINLRQQAIQRLVIVSRVSRHLTWTPPPAVGGYVQNIDLIANVFHLGNYRIAPSTVIDVLDQAIGVYEHELKSARWRLVNPFFWLELAAMWISSVPFRLLGSAGFDAGKASASTLGRLVKFVIELTVFGSAVATILQAFSLIDAFLGVFK